MTQASFKHTYMKLNTKLKHNKKMFCTMYNFRKQTEKRIIEEVVK